MVGSVFIGPIETAFYQYGETELLPDRMFLKKQRKLANKVFRTLQEVGEFGIAERYIAGSVGKKTNITKTDLDLVVVLNDVSPPFQTVLNEFVEILKANAFYLKIRRRSIRKTRFSVQFNFWYGTPVDLLPAVNLPYQRILQIIRNAPPDVGCYYSSSLVQRVLEFLKSHESSFVHVVIRLAKHWFKSLEFTGRVTGGSTMMELVAVAAAEREEYREEDPSALRAFTRFLGMIVNLDSIKLCFEEVEGDKWEKVDRVRARGMSLVPNVVGRVDILQRDRFIIEPANPFNDLLEDKDEKFFYSLNQFARETQRRFSLLQRGGFRDGNGVDFEDFFERQSEEDLESEEDSASEEESEAEEDYASDYS